jgi:cell division protein ZapA (FtsZ GTPase activity inhibitor)
MGHPPASPVAQLPAAPSPRPPVLRLTLPPAQQRHNETERQFKDVKRALEGLREGLKGASLSVAQTVTVFSSQSRSDEQLTRKFADAADCLEERCRSAAEGLLSTAAANVSDLLLQLGERTKFERRKALLLDLDSYKRKVKDLRDKEAAGSKMDLAQVRDKEDKLKSAERLFSDCNDDLMEMMQEVQDKKAELMEQQLVAAGESVAAFFTAAGKACAPLTEAVAYTKAHPTKTKLTKEHAALEAPAAGEGAFKPAGGSAYASRDPLASASTDPFATPPPAAAPAGSGAGAAAAAAAGGAAQRSATFDYAATEAGELTFSKGDVIAVVSEDPSGWWQGRNVRTGESGSFPVNYTVELSAGVSAGVGALALTGAAAANTDPFF